MKEVTNAFTMDTIVQTAFGTKIDSLKEPNNPIVLNASKLFSVEWSTMRIIKMTIMVAFPRLANALKLEFSPEVTRFFVKLSKKVIEDKRKIMQNNKDMANDTKAANFIDLLLEVQNEVDDTKTSSKCKFLFCCW